MAQLNVIPQEQADKLKERPLGLKVDPSPNGCQQSQAPFFCDYAVNYLLKDKSLGETVKDRKRLLQSGGLTIHTTIDLDYQAGADAAVSAHVNPTDQAIGGLAMVEPGTGYVRALAQSRPMGKDKAKGETYLNYVVPQKYGDANGFQAGSTFKAFVLAAAINQNIPLSTSITAPDSMNIPDAEFETCDGPYAGDGEGWNVSQLHGQRQLQPLHRHPAVGEHLLRPAGGADRHVRADRARREDGHQAPRDPAGAVLDPRRLRRQPAHDGGGLRHVRRSRHPLRRPPGHPDPRRRRQHA